MTTASQTTLPHHLDERTQSLNDRPINADADFVLCWLHHAIRDHDNPALDTAITIANDLGKPVLVYQGLGGNHRFNSDRHHTFIMQGARDLQAALAERGIAYAFHLPSDPSTPSPLRGLLERACAFVTEDFPAPPFPRWTGALADRAPCAAFAVDSACLMPMRLLTKRFERAFKFRDKAKKEWRARMREAWTDAEPAADPMPLDPDILGFQPLDLRTADLDELCAGCDIDHIVPPVPRAVGGMRAGYARWADFTEQHLARYDKRRNDAANMDAVSCLSPYLHHGHVSPMRIAREANDRGGSGADKFLDELLVWRELAYNFCAQTPSDRLESLDAIPEWAVSTLRDHEHDERAAVYTWEQLARPATNDELWNGAQRSLTRNGELHNNLRMSWGKMIPQWTTNAGEALHLLIDLNHRFALDGNNPNSYGGLLWSLGQFDRPFSPEEPVLGSVRPRSTEIHAQRLKPAEYNAAVRAREAFEPIRVAVVGAGIAGLTCARTLRDQGCDVTLFDRGRTPGGRLSTRTNEHETFDHGSPYFEVTDPRFGRYVRSWIESGVCARWEPTVGTIRDGALTTTEPERPLIVGVPGMQDICSHLARDLSTIANATVTSIARSDGKWSIDADREGNTEVHEGFDAIVLAGAPEQSARLTGSLPLHQALASIESDPQWSCMLTLDADLKQLPDLINVSGHAELSKIVRSGSKPGRNANNSSFVVYATHAWSHERVDADRDTVATALADAFSAAITPIASEGVTVASAHAHRWKFARVNDPVAERCLFDREHAVVVCGEGFGGTGVEGAFLSANAAVGRVLSLRPHRTRDAQHEDASLFGGANA